MNILKKTIKRVSKSWQNNLSLNIWEINNLYLKNKEINYLSRINSSAR